MSGPLGPLRALGARWAGPASEARPGRGKVNSHVHLPPNFSAFQTVVEASELASAQGVGVLGASNYYDFSVYGPFADKATSLGVFPLFGLEVVCLLEDLRQAGDRVNDPANPGKTYLCGKGITQFAPMNAAAAGLMGTVRSIDSDRIAAMIDKLNGVFARGGVETSLTEGSVKAAVVSRYGVPADTVYLQERHVAQAFQEALFVAVGPGAVPAALARVLGTGPGPELDAASVQNAIRTHLMKAGKPGYVEETFVGLDHAYQLVLALGGVPCYPVLADGAQPVCEFERPVERLVRSLRQYRVHCAELIPNRNAVPVLRAYVRALREAGIAVLAGTEHNTLGMVPIEPHCAGGAPVPEDLKDIFWEGACVIAAHQFLTVNGKSGYVDEHGEPDPTYPDAEARIKAFADLGAAVIEEYAGTALAHSVTKR
ncbi:MAG: hypothetical protein ACLQVK_12645 [Acidimicrobiales bacterium]